MSGSRIEHERKLFKPLTISEGDLNHAGRFADIILQLLSVVASRKLTAIDFNTLAT